MQYKAQEVCIIDLSLVVRDINAMNKVQEEEPGWIDPYDCWDLFFDMQEYGSNCYMRLDCGSRAVADAWTRYTEAKDCNEQKDSKDRDDVYVHMLYERWYILFYLRNRLPGDVSTVFVEIEY